MQEPTIEQVAFLFSVAAGRALEGLAEADLSPAATLVRLGELRRSFSADEAGALLDHARLRQLARSKFPGARQLWFTAEALQQASSLAVADYHARQYAGYALVADLGCGIGADTLALARVVPQVLAIERDPVRAALARANMAVLELEERVTVQCADWTALTLEVDAAFVDPARRVDGRRVFHLDQMRPPIAAIHALRQQVPHVLVKVAPGSDHAEIPADAE